MNTIKGMIEDLNNKDTHIGGGTTVGELIIALERLQMLEEQEFGYIMIRKGMKNGEVIQELFPNLEGQVLTDHKDIIVFEYEKVKKWLNSPYKESDKE